MTWPRSVTSARLALGAFVAYLVAAWFVLVFRVGAGRWFFRDDWMFLAGRDGGDLHDVFRPHDVHPAAVPVLVYRLMYNVFGLRFTPYLILIVTMHLGVAALLRVVMRRAGVGPWLASAAAGTLVLFGPGDQNILWAFQINFVGSLLLGLTQLVLADHDGPLDRRDLVGVAAGLGAVLCSGIGPVMVVAVAVSTFCRRGWRVALVHAGPAALTYLVWVQLAHPARYPFGRPPLGVVWDWVREGMVGTIVELGHFAIVGVALAGVLVVGGALLWTSTPRPELRRRAAIAVGLLLCAPMFFVLTAQGRWSFGLGLARSSRYIYVGVVCVLPALALAGEAIARRWRFGTLALVVLLLIGVPGNIGAFGSDVFSDRYFALTRQTVLGLPRTDEAEQVPRWVRPLPDEFNGDDLTIGWLLDARDAGHLPRVDDIDPRTRARFPINLGLAQVSDSFVGDDCRSQATPIDLSPALGDRIGIETPVKVATVVDGKPTSPWVTFTLESGQTLSVELPSLDLRFAPLAAGRTLTICR